VYVGFESLANHADGVADAVVSVDGKFMRKNVENFTIFGKRNVAGGIDGTAHIFAFNIARTIAQRDATTTVKPAYVAAGDSD
jgi:hypothetical protein